MNVSRVLRYLLAAIEHAVGVTERVRDMLRAAIARVGVMLAAA